jgi:hypothetical protein
VVAGIRKYSPQSCTSQEVRVIAGQPDPERISTSYIERSNLTLRMSSRRFTRLTNAFSKKIRNHAAAVALHHMHYNFARAHRSLSNPYPGPRRWRRASRIMSGPASRSRTFSTRAVPTLHPVDQCLLEEG